MSLLDWSTNPANNTSKPGIDWSEGQLPSTVNGSARGMMADVASWLLAPVFSGNTTINGTLNATGAITQNGSQVWHAGNFSPSNYAALAGAAFTGAVTATAFGVGVTPGYPFHAQVNVNLRTGVLIRNDSNTSSGISAIILNPAGNSWSMEAGSATRNSNLLSWNVDVLGTPIERMSLTTAGVLNVGNNITVGGNQVWHAGTFSPSNYAALSGAIFSGAVQSPSFRATGATAQTSFVDRADPNNGAKEWIVFNDTNALRFYSATTTQNHLTITSAATAVTGALSATGTISQAGNAVWHAGNLTPGNYLTTATAASTYAPLASPTFTGTATIPTVQLAAGITVRASGGKMVFAVGGSDVASLDSSGNLRILGSFTAAAVTL